MERLQKILSQAGIASRRASEQMMLDGRVSVNGATVRELGTKADAARDAECYARLALCEATGWHRLALAPLAAP